MLLEKKEKDREREVKQSYLSKKGWLAILLHINPIVTFAMNNTKIYNKNLYIA